MPWVSVGVSDDWCDRIVFWVTGKPARLDLPVLAGWLDGVDGWDGCAAAWAPEKASQPDLG